MDLLNVVLWGVQGFVALFFLAGGAPKIAGRGLDQWAGFSDLPRPLVAFIGLAEVLGALGLVLPMATGILPWLTPLSAFGLAAIMLLAAGFHVRANEGLQTLETLLWGGIAAVIVVGRWDGSLETVPPIVLIAAAGVLVPAVIINLAVLMKRGSTSDSSQSA